MNVLRPLLAASALALLAGCATSLVAHEGGRTTVAIANTSWSFLTFIPIASGDPSRPDIRACRFFENTATVDGNMEILRHVLKREKAYRAIDVTSAYTDEKILLFLLKRETCHTSAELIREPPRTRHRAAAASR